MSPDAGIEWLSLYKDVINNSPSIVLPPGFVLGLLKLLRLFKSW